MRPRKPNITKNDNGSAERHTNLTQQNGTRIQPKPGRRDFNGPLVIANSEHPVLPPYGRRYHHSGTFCSLLSVHDSVCPRSVRFVFAPENISFDDTLGAAAGFGCRPRGRACRGGDSSHPSIGPICDPDFR